VISPDALNAWRATHPWPDDEQIEQDLIMTRVAIEIASHPELSGRLAWRGGTCLHKLFLVTPLRYSEDLDYVAYDLSIEDDDMRRLRSGLRDVADTIGLEVSKHAKTTRSRLTEHLAYTSLGGTARRIKVEINLDEVPAIAPLDRRTLAVETDWWTGGADLLTFEPVELIATKFRALAQRSKGRDINDLDVAHRELGLNDGRLGHTAAHYLLHAEVHPSQFRSRLAAHLADPEFLTDVAVYLIDPALAGDPATLVNRWVLWTDRYLDLPYALLAHKGAPSKRKQRGTDDIRERLAAGTRRCPVHEYDGQDWRRCSRQIDGTDACPEHGPLNRGRVPISPARS
jgi:predicted nucleotidyltransferase component of viral defense system